MYNSELTALLCRKLNEEQESFRAWLVKQPAEEILRFAQQDVCCKGEFQNP